LKKLTVLFFTLIIISNSANAALDKGDVREMVKKIKRGEYFYNAIKAPKDSIQIFFFTVDRINYVIDFKVKDCFVGSRYEAAGYVPYSCKKIKRGYPILAPLLTWVR